MDYGVGLVSWKVLYSPAAEKDQRKLKGGALAENAKKLLEILAEDPFKTPPPCEKLVGKLKGKFSRRINDQHRVIYDVDPVAKEVRVLRMWTHYE